jgi:hypothetical protein
MMSCFHGTMVVANQPPRPLARLGLKLWPVFAPRQVIEPAFGAGPSRGGTVRRRPRHCPPQAGMYPFRGLTHRTFERRHCRAPDQPGGCKAKDLLLVGA